jgi:hypothetical protein
MIAIAYIKEKKFRASTNKHRTMNQKSFFPFF